jgi:hypothetical protein
MRVVLERVGIELASTEQQRDANMAYLKVN